jgi:uncharacterized GH25 family protein
MRFLVVLVLFALVFTAPLSAAKSTTRLNVLVQDKDGQPVPRASVTVRILKGKKHKKLGDTLQLRTSQQGTAPLPPIRQGFVLIQVIADGYQTYGDRVELREEEQTVTITLSPPQEQMSVHK